MEHAMTEDEKRKILEDQIKSELDIDETNLQEELRKQPNKYFYWSIIKARANERTRNKRLNLKEVEAQIGKELRSNVGKSVRVTEKLQSDYCAEHPKYKEAYTELVKAQYTEDLLEATVEAFKERHYALLEIVRSRESERIMKNEFEILRKEFMERENKRR